MDVICCGMYRACSTWQYEVIGHLIEWRRRGERLGYVEGSSYHPAPGRGRFRVLKCHDQHPRFALAVAEGDALAVYSYRDLRDVVDSMRHKTGRSFEALMGEGLVHRILSNDRFWITRPGVLVQRYEDLVADPASGVLELAQFLGISLTSDEAEEIAEAYSPEANRRRAEAVRRQALDRGLDPDDPSQILHHDPQTLLNGNHLRSGRVGGWREALSPDEQATLGPLIGSWLITRGYERDLSWVPSAPQGLRLSLCLARSRWHCLVYFTARRYPRLAAFARRLLRFDRPSRAELPPTASVRWLPGISRHAGLLRPFRSRIKNQNKEHIR